MREDLLVVGRIYTLTTPAVAGAALARAGRFVRVGTFQECRAAARPTARVLSLGEGCAVPGLADAHAHVQRLGAVFSVSDGSGRSRADADPGAPDARAGRLEAALSVSDGLERPCAGVDRSCSPDALTWAQAPVPSRISAPNPTALEDALLRGLTRLVAHGITAVHDAAAAPSELEAYQRLAERGALPLRVYAYLDGTVDPESFVATLERWRGRPELGRLSVAGVTLGAAGWPGSRTSTFLDPCAEAAEERGSSGMPSEELRRRLAAAVEAGFQPAIHTRGARGLAEALQAVAELSEPLRRRLVQLRPRVEHLPLLRWEEALILSRLGAVVSMQPATAVRAIQAMRGLASMPVQPVKSGGWAASRQEERSPQPERAYAWRTVLELGIPLAFGSGVPTESPDPRLGLRAAEVRAPLGAPGPIGPEQRLTRSEALRAFTLGPAYAVGEEGQRGAIREGMQADLTAFEGDVMRVRADALPALPITYTVVDGEVVHQDRDRR